MNSQTKNYREPAAQRKIGITALKNYFLGGVLAFFYIVFVSVPILSKYSTEVEYIGKVLPQELDSPETIEEKATKLYPMPTGLHIVRPGFEGVGDYIAPQSIHIEEMQEVQQAMFAWERKTAQRFLSNHPSMKPTRKKYFEVNAQYLHVIKPMKYPLEKEGTIINFLSWNAVKNIDGVLKYTPYKINTPSIYQDCIEFNEGFEIEADYLHNMCTYDIQSEVSYKMPEGYCF